MTASGNPADWANESHAAGQTAWIDNGGVLDDAYYNTQIQVVDKRLALAGLRLAALLEDVFSGQAQSDSNADRVVDAKAEASAGRVKQAQGN